MSEPITRVPVNDPRRAALALHAELAEAFERFLASGRYVLGPEHDAFERELAGLIGVDHCVAVASGTDALDLALTATCPAGAAVLVAANCGGYTTAAARRAGFSLRYADVDSDTLCLSRETVESALDREVGAVVVTHLYGLVGDVDGIGALCRERGIVLVEDCAQAAGARHEGRRAGSFGDVAAFSFYPTKNLAALGDGGALTTGDPALAGRLRALRQYGWEAKYRVAMPGGRNSRLDELQAAFLRVRLRHLDGWNAARRAIVERYAASVPERVGRFVVATGDRFVAHLAVLLCDDRDRVRSALDAAGIGTDVHYPIPDHLQPAWRADHPALRLPVTEHAAEHVLSVPCFPELTESEVEHVCEVLGGI
jgi:dTDP-4-amino-4,6-dideoxygalactose transaminase